MVKIIKNKFSVSNPLEVTHMTKFGRLAKIRMESRAYIRGK
jgi:hypothetical protein